MLLQRQLRVAVAIWLAAAIALTVIGALRSGPWRVPSSWYAAALVLTAVVVAATLEARARLALRPGWNDGGLVGRMAFTYAVAAVPAVVGVASLVPLENARLCLKEEGEIRRVLFIGQTAEHLYIAGSGFRVGLRESRGVLRRVVVPHPPNRVVAVPLDDVGRIVLGERDRPPRQMLPDGRVTELVLRDYPIVNDRQDVGMAAFTCGGRTDAAEIAAEWRSLRTTRGSLRSLRAAIRTETEGRGGVGMGPSLAMAELVTDVSTAVVLASRIADLALETDPAEYPAALAAAERLAQLERRLGPPLSRLSRSGAEVLAERADAAATDALAVGIRLLRRARR